MREARRTFRVGALTIEQVNFTLGLIADRMDELEGRRGTPQFKNDVNMGNNRMTRMAAAAGATDAVSKVQAEQDITVTMANNLTMTEELSAKSGGVTVTAAYTDIITLNMGSVTSGDRFFIQGFLSMVKGVTGGTSAMKIEKNSGTATITVHNDKTEFFPTIPLHDANATWQCETGGIVQVTATGNLIMKLSAISFGSNGVVVAGSGQLYAFFLKKQ